MAIIETNFSISRVSVCVHQTDEIEVRDGDAGDHERSDADRSNCVHMALMCGGCRHTVMPPTTDDDDDDDRIN